MEGGAGTVLACFAVAQINPIWFTRGYQSQRAAVALPGSFHRHPSSCSRSLADIGFRRALQVELYSIAPSLSRLFAASPQHRQPVNWAGVFIDVGPTTIGIHRFHSFEQTRACNPLRLDVWNGRFGNGCLRRSRLPPFQRPAQQ
jgi:hypothetical protein